MKYRLRFVARILLGIVAVAVLGWLVMALWNWVIPELFAGGRVIDYGHALGLLLLSRILFGGFRGRGGWHGRRDWRKWEAMTAEEREQFKQGMFCGRGRRAEG
jgi:hypothetical protein